MSRVVERVGRLVLVALFGKYNGNIAEAPGIKGRLAKLAQIPRYQLFHGEISEKYYIMVSQGTEITNPRRVIITCFGREESEVNQLIYRFLNETGIQEVDIPQRKLRAFVQKVKKLAAEGMVPEWMR